MRSFKLGVFALAAVALATPVLAADLPVKAAPIVAPVYNWSGWYVGANVGYSWGRSNTDVAFLTNPGGVIIPPPAGSITSAGFDMDGWVAGGQLGVNWQSGQWLLGLEADIQWTGQKGAANFLCAAAGAAGPCFPGLTATLPAGITGVSVLLDQKLEWFGTARARVGFLPSPNWLLYVTGGLAYGEITTSALHTSVNLAGTAVTTAASFSDTNFGWTVGGGFEGVISGPWTAKLEYLYMDLGSVSGTIVPVAPLAQAAFSSKITDHILRVGLNYRFWSFAPQYRM
jgi:outer membrane immunogenic protein